jgi:hypothetical protein
MAFAQFNNNPQSTWEDTRHPDHCFMIGSTGRKEVPGREPRTSERNEVAWQQCVAMANALEVDLWINVPHGAKDRYVRNLARLVLFGSDESGLPYKSRQANPAYPPLDGKHKLYVELSNEMWHPGFHQGVWAYIQHEKMGIPYGAVPGRRVSEIWSLFQEEFEKAGESWKERLVRVAGCSGNRIGWSREFVAEALKHGKALPDLKPEETMGGSNYTLSTRPDVLATANYFGNSIDQYVVQMSKPGGEHPFWDESDAPLKAVFREWQRRLITGGSGTNWVNATKGTLERDFIEIAEKNDLTLVGYEGGYGGPSLRSDNVYVKYPEVEFKDRKNKKEREAPGVVKGNLVRHAQRVAKMSNAPGNVGNIFSRFIRFRVMEAQGMEDVMRLQLELLKSGGMRLPCNTSEFDNPATMHDWGLAEYLPEPLAEAPRRRAALAFAAEHRNLNEVGQANGKGAPVFTTPVSLPVYIGRPMEPVKIEAEGGDGDLQIRVFGYWLPEGMVFDKDTLTLSGTTQTNERAFIFARVQDADGDIAYDIFMTEVFDPAMGEPYWRETFNELPNGTTEDDGDTAWSISQEGDVTGTCQVTGGVLEAVGVKEEKAKGEFLWKSEDIDISKFDSANLFIRATSNAEVDRGGDWLRIYYILDGAEPVQIADFSGQNAEVKDPEIIVKDLKGKTLRVEARMTNMNIEMYGLDEVSVFVPEK